MKKSETLGFLKKVFVLFRPFRGVFITGFLFVAFDELLSLAPAYVQSILVDGLIARTSFDTVLWAISGLIGIAVVQRLLGWGQRLFEMAYIQYPVPKFLQTYTFKKFFSFSIGQHRHEHSGGVQSVMGRGEASLGSFIQDTFYDILPQTMIALFSTISLWILNPLFGAITLSGMVLYITGTLFVNSRFKKQMARQQELWRAHSRIRHETLQNVDVIIANAQEQRATNEVEESLTAAQTNHRELWTSHEYLSLVVRDWVPIVTRGALMFLGAVFVWSGDMTPGVLIMLWSWSNQAISSARQFSRVQRKLMEATAAIRKYFEMLEREPAVRVPERPQFPHPFRGAVMFQNVTMRHAVRAVDGEEADATEQRPTLKDITFSVAANECVALVGESGAGKTTVIELLLRAYDPEQGNVLIDGIDLRSIDLARLRRSIGVVEQHVPLFDNTLRYNITYGLGDGMKLVSDASLDRVARAARIDHFFPKLEKGYDTVIGERGIKLSGGERQRIGIARALIKDPTILIFDEATSSLDATNEALIQESIEAASRGRTTIIIAHRFSTIRHARRIIVLANGRVVGDGPHTTLEHTCAAYRELLAHQVIDL